MCSRFNTIQEHPGQTDMDGQNCDKNIDEHFAAREARQLQANVRLGLHINLLTYLLDEVKRRNNRRGVSELSSLKPPPTAWIA